MYPDLSFWLLIVLAWFCALLPFLTELPFVFMPWRQGNQPSDRALWYGLRFILQIVLIIAAAYVVANVSDKIYQVAAVVMLFVLFALPALTQAKFIPVKGLAARLFELLAFYVAVGAIGFAIEANFANAQKQGWQFYVISLCLFIVLAYPGFVFRHLMKNKYNKKLITTE